MTRISTTAYRSKRLVFASITRLTMQTGAIVNAMTQPRGSPWLMPGSMSAPRPMT